MKIIYISTKLLYTIIIILIFLFACIFIFFKEYHRAQEIFLPITNRIIGIDPGHGGVDPGALSKDGLQEDEINLQIALKLKRYIEQSGGIVVLTRYEDKGLYTDKSTTNRERKTEDLMNRKDLIQGSDCEIFISIHLNSFTESKYSGAQTFYSKKVPDSQKLAYILQDELKNVLNKENNRLPEITEEIFILSEMDIPSVLVEAGFLSNEKEAKLLNTSEYQEKIAWSTYVGIMKYFSEME